MLAAFLRERRGQLTADFRRLYHLPLTAPRDEGWPLREFAACVAHLPPDSAIWRAGHPHGLTIPERMLVAMERGIRVISWQKTEDGYKGRNAPESLLGEPEQQESPMPGMDRMPVDDLRRKLGWDTPSP